MSVARICAAHDDARSLRLALLDELRRAVPFDAFAWLLTDPETQVGTAPIADVPCLDELPRLIRLKYATELNRWTHQHEAISRLHDITDGRLEQSLVWRELLADYDITDVASIVFRDRFGCWAFLDLWRTGSTFTPHEAAKLRPHVDLITQALRRCTVRTFSPQSVTRGAEGSGPVVLTLTTELDVRAQTPDTDRYLRSLLPPNGDRSPVPAAAYNVAAQLLAVENAVDDHPPVARVHDDARWLTVRAAHIAGDIAVTIERSSLSDRLTVLSRAAGLTARESELVDLLTEGADTKTIARRMFLSEHTVQDHLKSIFTKTGARNRRELLAQTSGP